MPEIKMTYYIITPVVLKRPYQPYTTLQGYFIGMVLGNLKNTFYWQKPGGGINIYG